MAVTSDDETSHGPPPRPSPPKRKRESLVIQGRASQAGASLAAPWGKRETLAGAVGGVVGAALALAGVWLFAARPDLAPLDHRVAALEAGAPSAADAQAQLADRVAALQAAGDKAAAARHAMQSSVEALKRNAPEESARLKAASETEAALAKRLATLEGAALRADSLNAVAAEARAAQQAADKALAAAGAPSDPRLDRLAADEAEIAALRGRLDKFAAPKATTRVSPTATVGASPAARLVAAMALQSRLDAGAPLAAPLAALDRLGVESAALAPLRAYAQTGAPTLAALARSLDRAPAPPAAGRARVGVAQRLLGEVQGLVKVRKVGESHVREADMSPVEAALAAGDLAGALVAFAGLAPSAQAAAQKWRESAEARLAAGRAAEALVERALGDLGARR